MGTTKTRRMKMRMRRRHPPMAAAARVGDPHVCRMETNGVPHKGGEILPPGSPDVLIGDERAARLGDRCWCEGGMLDVIVEGAKTVLINEKPAARKGDCTDGGAIAGGNTTSLFGRRHET